MSRLTRQFRAESSTVVVLLDVTKSWSVSVDGTTHQAEQTKYINRVSFKVPAAARKFQLTVTPHVNLHWTALRGTSVDKQAKEVTAPEPISFDLTFL